MPPKRTNISTRSKFVDIQTGGREGRADTVLCTDHVHNHGIIMITDIKENKSLIFIQQGKKIKRLSSESRL